MGMMTLICGTEESNLKDLGPEEVVDHLVQEITEAKARRDSGTSLPLPDGEEEGLWIPVPGT